MKICILTPRYPFPENGGDVLRINNIARYLKSKGHFLILISFVNNMHYEKKQSLYDKIYIVKRNKFVSIKNSFIYLLKKKPIQCGYYYSTKYLKMIKKVIDQNQPDLYISHLIRMAPYLIKLNICNDSILEMTDALSKTYKLSSKSNTISLKKTIYKIENRFIANYEKLVINVFHKVVLVSNNDIEYLRQSNSILGKNLFCYTNGVICKNNQIKNYNKHKISFVGNMRTLQNQDAVLHFISDILPVIRKQDSNVIFEVIGAEPSKKIQNLNGKNNIVITGFVNSIEDTISDSCLVVAPVQIAAGIQNKVLIAMACNVPVVLTSLISEAIPELHNEENCYIKDDNQDFSDSCIKIMKNPSIRNKIANNGFNMVKNSYSWNAKLQGYEKM